jgi:transglycosylase-like protein with SLT domain
MPKVPSVCFLALALTVSTAFAGFSPTEKETPEAGSGAEQTYSPADRNYDSIDTADLPGKIAELADPAQTSATADAGEQNSPAIRPDDICDALVASAQANGLPAVFFSNLIWQESRFHPNAVSPAGALGIAQFMPKTAATVGLEDPLDPQQALPASARLLAKLYHEFGNLGLAAAAYNAGGKRVSDWLSKGTVLPKETRNYVLTITGRPVEQWPSSNSGTQIFTLAKKMPCRGVAAFTAAAANEGGTLRDPAAAENRGIEPSRVTELGEPAVMTEREALQRRVAAMRERWTALRKHWAALSTSGHSPAELPMDVGLAQTKKTFPKKPIAVGDASPKLIRFGDASPKLIRVGDASAKLVRVGDASPKPIRVADASPEVSHKGKLERLTKRRHGATSS